MNLAATAAKNQLGKEENGLEGKINPNFAITEQILCAEIGGNYELISGFNTEGKYWPRRSRRQ